MLNYQRVTRNIMSQHWSTRKPKKKHEETKKLLWSTQLTTFCAMVKGKAQVGSGLLFGWRELTNLCTNMYIVYTHIYIGMILDTNVVIVPLKMRFLPDSQRWPWRHIFFTASESACFFWWIVTMAVLTFGSSLFWASGIPETVEGSRKTLGRWWWGSEIVLRLFLGLLSLKFPTAESSAVSIAKHGGF